MDRSATGPAPTGETSAPLQQMQQGAAERVNPPRLQKPQPQPQPQSDLNPNPNPLQRPRAQDTPDALHAPRVWQGAPQTDIAGPAVTSGACASEARRLWAVARRSPSSFGLFPLLRRIEATHPHLPRLGAALTPGLEPLRIGQVPDLTFAATSVSAVDDGLQAGASIDATDSPGATDPTEPTDPPEAAADVPASGAPMAPIQGRAEGDPDTSVAPTVPRIDQRVFGLLGPGGPLPLHWTEWVRDRERHGEPAPRRFMDLWTHRFALLFYRAWAQPNGRAALGEWDALIGLGLDGLGQRDALEDDHRRRWLGRLARPVRDADGLARWCAQVVNGPVSVQQWRGWWMPLEASSLTRLNGGQRLGRGAVLGRSVWDVQHGVRLHIGPVPLSVYGALLPGATGHARLQALVRHWAGLTFDADLVLLLRHADVPPLRLGGEARMGRTAWLRHSRPAQSPVRVGVRLDPSCAGHPTRAGPPTDPSEWTRPGQPPQAEGRAGERGVALPADPRPGGHPARASHGLSETPP
ncbi:type VI secretion system baseplate subunit TssG [Roseateles amylovorans]|uniref:Type VI secretion system baseplate subunit TssG n=1 Tax=Roseateles amylovorans TaxID=2978473 RepID=A0ABY6AZZ4_9BURK|nr:type VI secretion system baseplate subunit TssG [Roseateles amylovorans]UXH78522.1 type VI secretion system baseplate subunit TssG [Roseateles amylovorans]